MAGDDITKDMPDTFVGVLDNIVRWLDMTDPIVKEAYPQAVQGRDVQASLERLMVALTEKPDLDATLIGMMRGTRTQSGD